MPRLRRYRAVIVPYELRQLAGELAAGVADLRRSL